MDTGSLEERIGHQFKKRSLLRQALTHRSHGQPNNERLEFLGDSVLNCAIATVLFERFPDVDEGDLSRLRAYLVKQQALHKVAQRLALGEHLVLGEGESRSGGTRRPSILADALEALIGAVFLDAGFPTAQSVIDRLYEPELKDADPLVLGKDAKTLLQEALQRDRLPLPVYSVVATHGAAHSQIFEVECAIARMNIRVLGSGRSRRAAEQAAAADALSALDNASAAKPRKKPAKKRATKKKRSAAKAGKSTTPEPVVKKNGSPAPATAQKSADAEPTDTDQSKRSRAGSRSSATKPVTGA